MTIYYYDKGEHPTGFEGYRVAVSMGGEGVEQAYFTTRQLSERTALREAIRRDNELTGQAILMRAGSRLKNVFKPVRKNPSTIIRNMSGALCIEKTRRLRVSGDIVEYYSIYPAFVVNYTTEDGKHRNKKFRISTVGFEKAFDAAIDFYAEAHGLTDELAEEIMGYEPSHLMFTHDLYEGLVKRCRSRCISYPSRTEIAEMLK